MYSGQIYDGQMYNGLMSSGQMKRSWNFTGLSLVEQLTIVLAISWSLAIAVLIAVAWFNSLVLFVLLQFGSSGGNQLFGVHYDAISHKEAFFNGQGQRLLSIKYKSGILPAQWTFGMEPNCTQKYDR